MIVLTGPTAIGKSAIAVKLAIELGGEIISADSMQVYRGCDIGTGKITQSEMHGVRHHLIDIIDPDVFFTAKDFRERADGAIAEVKSRNRLPIVVGGTGFYIRTLLYDLDFGGAQPSGEVRARYNNLLKERGEGYLYELLQQLDPESAQKIHPNDTKRIVRSLEIYELTGTKKSEVKSGSNPRYSDFKLVKLDMDRAKLYSKINSRVDAMIEGGLIDEAKKLLPYKNYNSMQAIGYKEIFLYLDGQLAKEEAIELLKKNTRNYAKRQQTYLKQLEGYVYNVENRSSMSDIVTDIAVLCQT